jgi:hypothetical protein
MREREAKNKLKGPIGLYSGPVDGLDLAGSYDQQ